MERQVNNYIIETIGGFITVKHWVVMGLDKKYKGTFFTFKDAKTACLDNDFSKAYQGSLY